MRVECPVRGVGAGVATAAFARARWGASEQRFRQLVEQANDIIYTLNAEGTLTYVSPNWPCIQGHEVEEVPGQVMSFLGISHDVTPRREMEQKVLHLAQHDTLTDLPNRSLFFSHLSSAIAQSKRCDTPLALLFIDLDDFKPINDRFGHGVGDQLLQAVAQRLPARC